MLGVEYPEILVTFPVELIIITASFVEGLKGSQLFQCDLTNVSCGVCKRPQPRMILEIPGTNDRGNVGIPPLVFEGPVKVLLTPCQVRGFMVKCRVWMVVVLRGDLVFSLVTEY